MVTLLAKTCDIGKKTLSFLPHSCLLPQRANLGYILSLSPLMYPRSEPRDEAKMRLLGHVLSHCTGQVAFIHSDQLDKTCPTILILASSQG